MSCIFSHLFMVIFSADNKKKLINKRRQGEKQMKEEKE